MIVDKGVCICYNLLNYILYGMNFVVGKLKYKLKIFKVKLILIIKG